MNRGIHVMLLEIGYPLFGPCIYIVFNYKYIVTFLPGQRPFLPPIPGLPVLGNITEMSHRNASNYFMLSVSV